MGLFLNQNKRWTQPAPNIGGLKRNTTCPCLSRISGINREINRKSVFIRPICDICVQTISIWNIFIKTKRERSFKPFLKFIENKASEALVEENESIKSVYLHLGFNKIKTVT